jgi:hypothetical protein
VNRPGGKICARLAGQKTLSYMGAATHPDVARKERQLMSQSLEIRRTPFQHPEGRLSLAWIPAAEWEDFLLAVELAGGEYAAFAVEHYGWLVLTTARLHGRNVRDIPREREYWLEDFLQKHNCEMMLCSPGWSGSALMAEPAAVGA